jgi:hypothetical protein
MEGAILVIMLGGLSFITVYIYDRWITTRLWRQWLWWKVPRMDVRAEEHTWELVADAALNCIDNQYLTGKICGGLRLVMLQKLRHSPGLGYQFSPQNIQRVLKEVIRERLGTHTTPRFPDPGPYVFAYIKDARFDDRSVNTLLLLKMRTGKWRTKEP